MHLEMVDWLAHLLRNHRVASSTPASAITHDAPTSEKLMNIELNLVLALQIMAVIKRHKYSDTMLNKICFLLKPHFLLAYDVNKKSIQKDEVRLL